MIIQPITIAMKDAKTMAKNRSYLLASFSLFALALLTACKTVTYEQIPYEPTSAEERRELCRDYENRNDPKCPGGTDSIELPSE